MKTQSRLSRLLFLVALVAIILAVWIPVSAAEQVPMRGQFEGQGGDFSGNFTHLGTFVGSLDQSTLLAVWTAANGDTVLAQTTAFALGDDLGGGLFRYEQSIAIVGGTGRFDGASGGVEVTGTFNVLTGVYDGAIVGTISSVGSL